jgi:integrase
MTVVRYGRGSVINPDKGHTTYGYVMPQFDELGTRKQVKVRGFATYREAEIALDAWRHSVNQKTAVEPSRLTIADLLAQWLESECSDLRPKTIESYTYSAQHISRRIGGKRAQALEARDIDALKRVLMRETSDRVAHNALKILRQALGWATRIELVQRNVSLLVDLPTYQPDEGIALSHAQARAFLEAAEGATYSPLWLLYLSTGVRRGEGLGLKWSGVDLRKSRVAVHHAVTLVQTDGKSRPTLSELKTRSSRRVIDIDARLGLALEEHLERQRQERERAKVWFDNDLVFCTGNGLILSPDNVRKVFYQLRDSSGMPSDLTIHDLRHSHASHLVLAGVPLVEVSRRLGHAKPDITLRLYSHLMPGYVGSATAAVERALYPAPAPALDTSGVQGTVALASPLGGTS